MERFRRDPDAPGPWAYEDDPKPDDDHRVIPLKEVKHLMKWMLTTSIPRNVDHPSALFDPLARKFIAVTREQLGITTHREDIAIDVDGLLIECRWMPETREAELVGGPRDGAIFELEDHSFKNGLKFGELDHGGYRAWTAEPIDEAAETPIEPLPLRIRLYLVTGWHEARRRWVMTDAGS